METPMEEEVVEDVAEEVFKHTCVKPECTNTYSDTDPEAYYCENCKEQRLAIAKEIDTKIPQRARPQNFEERMGNYQSIRGITMINLPKNGN